jgi:soluble P-type ATPase
MIRIDIPGYRTLTLDHLVLDFNGTLAVDGHLAEGVRERLTALSEQLDVHVLTADTFGRVSGEMAEIPCRVSILSPEAQDHAKRAYVEELGADRVAAMGNGRNDRRMLAAAALGVAVLLEEGVSVETLTAADVACRGIVSALDLLTHPLRLVASLRS